jgi:hypothetical protein
VKFSCDGATGSNGYYCVQSLQRILRAHLVLGGSVLVLLGCARGTTASNAVVSQASDGPDVERLRAATRPFLELDAAVAAGYPREVADCLVHEHHGAMGYHHVNRAYVDGKAEIERPEILLYEKQADGKHRLNGVEFIVPYRFWPRDSVPPVIMGQKMKHEDNLKFWYVHVWAWNRNPDGVFADFHPGVTCPASAAKVFTPFAATP